MSEFIYDEAVLILKMLGNYGVKRLDGSREEDQS